MTSVVQRGGDFDAFDQQIGFVSVRARRVCVRMLHVSSHIALCYAMMTTPRRRLDVDRTMLLFVNIYIVRTAIAARETMRNKRSTGN